MMLLQNPGCKYHLETLSELSKDLAVFLNSLPLIYWISVTPKKIYQAQRLIEDSLETHPLIIKFGKKKKDPLEDNIIVLIDYMTAERIGFRYRFQSTFPSVAVEGG